MTESLDRKKTQMVKGKNVTFTLLEPSPSLPPLEKVTSVAVVPFVASGDIVVALLKRGADLPGGHMQVNETTFEETARREAFEEAFITLSELEIACVIQSDFYGSAEDELTYMIVMAGLVDKLEPEQPNDDTGGRKIIPVEQFIQEYSAGNKDFMHDIVYKARSIFEQKWKSPGTSWG